MAASFTDFTYKRHCHEEYAFGVTLRGIQQFHLSGEAKISYPHGVILFNPEQVHDGSSQDQARLKYVMVYIQPKLLLELLEKKEMLRFAFPVIYDRKLEQSILNLSDAVLNSGEGSLCSELLLAFADHFVKWDLSAVYKKDNMLTKKVKEMIHYSLENGLRLDDICKELNITKFKLIRAFKASTGLSPYQYFLNCKVLLARRLIEKNRDVYTAVTDCGFFDVAHLNRHFKNVYGITAYEYLNLI